MTITADRLREVLDYDPDTGFFLWKIARTKSRYHDRPGVRAGCIKYSHRYIQIDGRGYQAGRLAWLHIHGKWPKRIFRVNGDRLDDRLENLRDGPAPVYRGTRLPGIYQKCNKFEVSFKSRGKHIYVGCFDTFEEAKAALATARKQHAAPSRFGRAKWIYKVKAGWLVRVRLTRKGKCKYLGTFKTLKRAQRVLAWAYAPKAEKKHWWDDPGAMAAE